MGEVWKDIQGYEGLYQVSNLGNVKSLNYRRSVGNEKFLAQKENNDGRLWVTLYKNGKSKPMLVHRLVGTAFIPNPECLPQINHKDENPKNNNASNLEWCTHQYNINYYVERHGRKTGLCAKRKKKNAFPIKQIDSSGNVVKEWEDAQTVFTETGMSAWSISECCRGNRKQAYGFKWQYAV